MALTLGHAANVARRDFGGDGFLFRPLAGQICPTARALVCIGQRAVLGLFRADTALTGGGGAGSGFLLAVLSGLGFCQFPPLMPHKSCRLFRSRTYKICRFLLSEVIIIFPRGGAGLFFRFLSTPLLGRLSVSSPPTFGGTVAGLLFILFWRSHTLTSVRLYALPQRPPCCFCRNRRRWKA